MTVTKDEQLIELINENKKLKEKIKQKSEKLKTANKRIESLNVRLDLKILDRHYKNTQLDLLMNLTSHIDKSIYKIEFKYKNKIYTEKDVESFGTRWLKDSLILHVAQKGEMLIYSWEIEIINAQKLW